MKFVERRPLSGPDVAARKIVDYSVLGTSPSRGRLTLHSFWARKVSASFGLRSCSIVGALMVAVFALSLSDELRPRL